MPFVFERKALSAKAYFADFPVLRTNMVPF
jgi:hypothetical protein